MGAFTTLFGLLCCPPIPSHIAAKIAFLPPSPPSYTVRNGTLCVKSSNGVYMACKMPRRVTLHSFKANNQNTLAGLYFECEDPNAYTLLYSHGNAADIVQMMHFFRRLSMQLKVNIFCYDYSGYGFSTGKPSEKNAYLDVEAAYNYIKQVFKTPTEHIVLYGQSIGSGPSIWLATKESVACLVLHAPIMSGIRTILPDVTTTYCCDIFPNIERIGSVTCLVLVMQGTDDEVVNIRHGMKLYESAQRPLEPLWAANAGHNDLELHPDYLPRLRKLIRELPVINSS